MPTSHPLVHAGWLRAIHWLNALAVLVLVMSGWKIYNATGFLGFVIPGEITLGGWLGGALLWHFAAMWLFGVNGMLYLLLNLVSGRFKTKFFPLSARTLWADVRDALRGKLAHADPRHYNMVQRAALAQVSCQAKPGMLLARTSAHSCDLGIGSVMDISP